MVDNGDIPPKLISDLIQYEQLKDEMSGLFLSSPGVDQDVMPQSEVDEIFEWLKKTETNHEKTRRFKLLEHYIITFEQKPGWKMTRISLIPLLDKPVLSAEYLGLMESIIVASQLWE